MRDKYPVPIAISGDRKAATPSGVKSSAAGSGRPLAGTTRRKHCGNASTVGPHSSRSWKTFLKITDRCIPATFGAIRTFSDRARTAGLDPMDLTPERVPPFLDAMPVHEREASVKALKALWRHRVFPQVSAFLPSDFDPAYLFCSTRTTVPEAVRKMIADMVETRTLRQEHIR